MSDPKYHTGMVVRTSKSGELVLSIHPATAMEWLKTIETNEAGWAGFRFREKKVPVNSITHTLHQVNYNQDVFARTTKPEHADIETKSEEESEKW